jgi:hypothetical protein
MAGLMIRWFICRFITMRRERHGRLIGSQAPNALSSCNIYSVTAQMWQRARTVATFMVA